GARAPEVLNEVFDLVAILGASNEQLDVPALYASGRSGWAAEAPEGPRENLTPLFELILRHVAPPEADREKPFALLATILERDPYLGRVLTGRIESGVARVNMPLKALHHDPRRIEEARLTKLLAFRGLDRQPIHPPQP